MDPIKETKAGSYGKPEERWKRALFHYPFFALASHWVFQGILYMDPTERIFKIITDLILTFLGTLLLIVFFPPYFAIAISFLMAHSINFFLNGHLWGILKHYGLVQLSYQEYNSYVQGFCDRTLGEPAICYAAIYGSIAREQWTPSSDLDVRLVRFPGAVNSLRACWFVMGERRRALIARFPLDVYVFDAMTSLSKQNPHEFPVEIIRRN